MRLKSQNQALIFKSIRNPLSGKDPGLRTLIYAPNVLSENILINLQRLKTKQKLLQLTYGLGTVSRQQCRDKQNPGLPERQRWSLESRGPGSQSVCTAACWIEESCIEIGFRGTAEGSPQVSDYVVSDLYRSQKTWPNAREIQWKAGDSTIARGSHRVGSIPRYPQLGRKELLIQRALAHRSLTP